MDDTNKNYNQPLDEKTVFKNILRAPSPLLIDHLVYLKEEVKDHTPGQARNIFSGHGLRLRTV